VAGQLAKLRGCCVIGSAGSAEKVRFLREECGFDGAFNYKAGPVLGQLNRRRRTESMSISIMWAAKRSKRRSRHWRVHGRIIACGGISGYNEGKPRPGPSNLFNITTKRLTMKGLIVSDSLDRRAEFETGSGGYFKAGKLKHKETVVQGIDRAVGAFIGLFQGQNIGKMVVELA